MAGVETPPYALQNASHGAQLFRLAAGVAMSSGIPGTNVSPLYGVPSGSTYVAGPSAVAGHNGGIVNPTDFAITQNGGGAMNVNVAGGQIFIPGGSVANQGMYYGLSDAVTNLTIATASASNPRIDTIIAYVEDAAYSGANNDWKLAVVTGTATSGATLSNLTGAGSLASFPNCVVLGFVLVPTSAGSILTADILNSQPYAASYATGNLANPYTVTASLATFLTTTTLSAGIWVVMFTANARNLSSSSDMEIQANLGTATGSLLGTTSMDVGTGSGTLIGVPAAMNFVAVLQTAGTLVFQAVGTSSDQVASATAAHSYPNATGYVALRVTV